jgi:DNA-binding CsgD family transcriptional regulator
MPRGPIRQDDGWWDDFLNIFFLRPVYRAAVGAEAERKAEQGGVAESLVADGEDSTVSSARGEPSSTSGRGDRGAAAAPMKRTVKYAVRTQNPRGRDSPVPRTPVSGQQSDITKDEARPRMPPRPAQNPSGRRGDSRGVGGRRERGVSSARKPEQTQGQPLRSLTTRELKVLTLRLAGYTDNQIAVRMGISRSTVEVMIKRARDAYHESYRYGVRDAAILKDVYGGGPLLEAFLAGVESATNQPTPPNLYPDK